MTDDELPPRIDSDRTGHENRNTVADDSRAESNDTTGRSGVRQRVLSDEALEATFPDYEGQVVESRRLEPEPASTVPPGDVLRSELADALDNDLFSHQAAALERLADDDNVVVTTSTSSGKTWVYALQIARNYLADPESTALALYPMKALSRDQERELNDKLRDDWGLDVSIGVYDGDTPSERKRRIRTDANVVITNPAGLNVYLPRHNKDRGWHRFYSNLDLVVVDEAHEYAGVTGTHVAWILRRLRRILEYYDSDPQFSLTTATIGNPADHAERLTGETFAVVDEDGSPQGRRDVVLWEPPIDWDQVSDGLEENELEEADHIAEFEHARRSTGSEAAKVTAHLASNDVQTLLFSSARQGTEIAAKQIGDAADSHGLTGDVTARAYHAGLGKKTRRGIETMLKNGRADAVATTNALELGIDIGSVDATVTSGYPGTKQSFWQQVGRAGRGTSDALSVLVEGADAMDSYILDNPGYLFDDAVEDAVVSIDNDQVYADHLLVAAVERPLRSQDAAFFGGEERFRDIVEMWQDAGALDAHGRLDDDAGVVYTGDRRPQSRVSMYNTGDIEFEVVCINGDIDHDPVAMERAYRDYHEGALFLHAGQQYEVVEVEQERPRPRILVEQVNTGHYTQTLSDKWITELQPRAHRSLAGDYDLYFGQGTVDVTYNEYMLRAISTGDLVDGPRPTGSPSLTLNTEILWVSLPENHVEETIDALAEPLLEPTERANRDRLVPTAEERYTYAGGIHAAEHGVIQLAPLELLIDNNDIGGLSTTEHPHQTIPGPVWFVHDGIDGGIGFTRSIYEHFDTILARTREHIRTCDCGQRRGCPLCVMSEDCGNNNDPLDRATADLILTDVLDAL